LPKHSPFARPLPLLALTLVAALAGGCKSNPAELDTGRSPERIHRQATLDLANGNYPSAIQRLELLEARFPFTDPARQAQVDLMYAYYKNRETESAIDQADQFIRENPTHPRVDYAYYIRGLVHFEAGANLVERIFKADLDKRPPQEARMSFQSFQTLVQSYPKSPYAADARQRMVYLRNRLAQYELEVARYYMSRGAYVGALNRARNLVETYDGAPSVPAALKISAQAYRKLGMDDLAKVADDIRAANVSPDVVSPMAASAGLAVTGAAATGPGAPPLPPEPQRAGRWEARVGMYGTGATDLDTEAGSTVEVDGSTGFMVGIAWHYSDRLQFGSNLSFDSKDYTVEVAGEEEGDSFEAKGSLDSMALMLDAAYNILTGPLTPYVNAGIGYAWVDTNIATEPPSVGCWWNPWYGYVCTSWQDTKTLDGFAYEVKERFACRQAGGVASARPSTGSGRADRPEASARRAQGERTIQEPARVELRPSGPF
jgi:outer membrane protein assembly factor BamD